MQLFYKSSYKNYVNAVKFNANFDDFKNTNLFNSSGEVPNEKT